jgi:hypothetical protein
VILTSEEPLKQLDALINATGLPVYRDPKSGDYLVGTVKMPDGLLSTGDLARTTSRTGLNQLNFNTSPLLGLDGRGVFGSSGAGL